MTSNILTCVAVDGPIPDFLMYLSQMSLSMIFKFCAVIYFTPVFIFLGFAIGFFGYWLGQIYMKAQLSVKREMSNAKSPVLAQYGSFPLSTPLISRLIAASVLPSLVSVSHICQRLILGLLICIKASIRAYGAQNSFMQESYKRIDKYTRTARTYYNLNRWIDVRIDALGSLFSASLAAYLVYGQPQNASNVGFSLNMAIGFSGMILWWVRLLNMFEVQGVLRFCSLLLSS